jgi:hypothetical protein
VADVPKVNVIAVLIDFGCLHPVFSESYRMRGVHMLTAVRQCLPINKADETVFGVQTSHQTSHTRSTRERANDLYEFADVALLSLVGSQIFPARLKSIFLKLN